MATSDSIGGASKASAIPVYHVTSTDLLNGRPGSMTPLEKEMDEEVAKVLQDWDENVKTHKQASFHIRPKSTSGNHSNQDRRRRRISSSKSPHRNTPSFPEIEVIRRDDPSMESTMETIDDETRKQYYVECPDTGHKMFKMELDIHGYDQSNISVKLQGSRLIIHAVQKETVDGKKSTTEFCRKLKLPSDVDIHKLQCMCKNDKLMVQAPVVCRQQPARSFTSSPSMPSFSAASPRPPAEPLNVPKYRISSEGRVLNLLVDVGRVFRAEDVLVKVKSQNKVIVNAQREDQQSKSKLSASLTREFELDENIIPETLKAGLTTDGVLKVTAQVIQEVKVIINGVKDSDCSSTSGSQNGV